MTKLYEIIDLLRNERNITWQKLHKDTGISVSTMFEWKKEDASVKSDSLEVLADYFDVSIDFLLGRTLNRYSHKNELHDSSMIIMQAAESSNLDKRDANIVAKLIKTMDEEH